MSLLSEWLFNCKRNKYLSISLNKMLADPELDGSQRIAVLQQKLSDLRKTYNAVKVELAAIERRRKKLRRREREGKRFDEIRVCMSRARFSPY